MKDRIGKFHFGIASAGKVSQIDHMPVRMVMIKLALVDEQVFAAGLQATILQILENTVLQRRGIHAGTNAVQ
ncbi:hypothetical protein D9M68_864470 [compost metagenome]